MERIRFTGKNCLVCEDDELNIAVFMHIFRNLELEIEVASNGIEALERINRKKFDVILSDICMPGMNGLDLIRKIRSHADQTISQTPVIAITGSLSRQEQRTFEEAGFSGCLLKPLSETLLIDMLCSFME